MKKKLLLGLSLLVTSFMAYADGGVKYGLINTSSSTIPNPIKVTQGYISYYFSEAWGPLPAHCPQSSNPIKVDLGTITSLPLPIYQGTESKFTFTIDPSLQDCFVNDYSSVFINLNITQVDGITKQDGVCQAAITPTLNDYKNNVYSNMNIEETTDSFYCNVVMKS